MLENALIGTGDRPRKMLSNCDFITFALNETSLAANVLWLGLKK